jgi:hypothetical protein
MADSLLVPLSPPAVPSVKRDASDARSDLKRDQRAERDLNQVIHHDSHTLSSDEHQLHEVREALAHDSTKDRTAAISADKEKDTQLEQSVVVLKGCLAAEHELAVEDARDIRLDRQQLKLDGQG